MDSIEQTTTVAEAVKTLLAGKLVTAPETLAEALWRERWPVTHIALTRQPRPRHGIITITDGRRFEFEALAALCGLLDRQPANFTALFYTGRGEFRLTYPAYNQADAIHQAEQWAQITRDNIGQDHPEAPWLTGVQPTKEDSSCIAASQPSAPGNATPAVPQLAASQPAPLPA